MKISAHIENRAGDHKVMLKTEERSHKIQIPPKEDGFGSGTSGGELLFLALATCYCNDIYREAEKKNIKIESLEVKVEGTFNGIGQPAADIRYQTKVTAHASKSEILKLIIHTDTVAEIHNTLRAGVSVELTGIQTESL